MAIVTKKLGCGLTVVVEPMNDVGSVAVEWRVPGGAASDPASAIGRSALLSEFVLRGAGGLNSRALSDALDRLGVQRSVRPLAQHMQITATMLGARLESALPILADVVLKPALPEDALDAVRSLCLQGLDSLDDDPQHLVMLRLMERHLPAPRNRHGYGEREVLETASLASLRETWAANVRPEGSLLTVAGSVEPSRLVDQLESILEGWTGAPPAEAPPTAAKRGYVHITQDTSQVHIGAAYDAPREADDTSMLERLGTRVLSGSTSGRLFTEVRAKRSLCYSVGASYRAGREDGRVTLYAGTTPQRAQETLDVALGEVVRLRDGVAQDEFDRAVIGLKSQLIMHGESTPARAAGLASDQFRIGRARSLDELESAIDAISREQLQSYLAERSFGPFTIVSIGPEPLEPPAAVATEQLTG